MRKKLSLIILVTIFAFGTFMTINPNPIFAKSKKPVIIGFIGSFDSDAGKSTLRGAEIAIEEINAAGGMLGGRKLKG